MRRTFVRLPSFERAWGAMGLTEDDCCALEDLLLVDPRAGVVIEGSGGVRKIRFAAPGKGKRGGIRVIYVDIVIRETIYLLYAYPKSVRDDLTRSEIADLKRISDRLKSGK